jgi:hypothetical protein
VGRRCQNPLLEEQNLFLKSSCVTSSLFTDQNRVGYYDGVSCSNNLSGETKR